MQPVDGTINVGTLQANIGFHMTRGQCGHFICSGIFPAVIGTSTRQHGVMFLLKTRFKANITHVLLPFFKLF